MYEHLVIFVAKKTNEIPENSNTIEINTHAHMIQKLNSVLKHIYKYVHMVSWLLQNKKICVLVFTQ